MRCELTFLGRPTEEVTLVDILQAWNTPDPLLVRLYYGDNHPRSATRWSKYTRLIFQRDDGAYVVVPDIPLNKVLWRRVRLNSNREVA
jgi:hypothetical protein